MKTCKFLHKNQGNFVFGFLLKARLRQGWVSSVCSQWRWHTITLHLVNRLKWAFMTFPRRNSRLFQIRSETNDSNISTPHPTYKMSVERGL